VFQMDKSADTINFALHLRPTVKVKNTRLRLLCCFQTATDICPHLSSSTTIVANHETARQLGFKEKLAR